MSGLENDEPRWCVEIIESFGGSNAPSLDQIASLARRLAESGVVLATDPASADVASTGGPASLTTFLPPLILASRGVRVPKIGVPGRPAGVIDTLGIVPGYQSALSAAEFRAAIDLSCFDNTLSAGIFAPADGTLFRARQRFGAQANPYLVVASLLSKKIAAGLSRVVFDIRTFAGGNFGEARERVDDNIGLLQAVAANSGIAATCVVSDGDRPAQPMLGRAEALRGLLAILRGTAAPWLERHYIQCLDLASRADAGVRVTEPNRERILITLDRHLRAQGSSGLSAVDEYLAGVDLTHPTMHLLAPRRGRLVWRMEALRQAVVRHQGQAPADAQRKFFDACGVELLKDSGDLVQTGEAVAQVRAIDVDVLRAFLNDLERAFEIHDASQRPNEQGAS